MNDYEKYLREESPTFMGEPSVKKQRNYPNAADYAEATQGVDMADFQRKILAAPSPAPVPVDPAELEALRRDAALGRAIERAAEELPDFYNIQIDVSKDSGTASLSDSKGCWMEFSSDHESLADTINDAIDAALAANGEKGT